VEAVERELEVLRTAPLPEDQRRQLLGLAYLVATRRLAGSVLEALFGRDLMLLEEVEAVQRIAEKHHSEGRDEGRRLSILEALREKFHPLPERVEAAVGRASGASLDELFLRALRARSLDDLGL
jgi:hypothetical protein